MFAYEQLKRGRILQRYVILVAEGWQTHERVEKDEFALKFLEFGISTEDVGRNRLILTQDLNNVDLQKYFSVIHIVLWYAIYDEQMELMPQISVK